MDGIFDCLVDNMPYNDFTYPFVVAVIHEDEGTLSVIGCDKDGLNYLGCEDLSALPLHTATMVYDEEGEAHTINIISKGKERE